MPFPSFARFTRHHAYRLVVPPLLAFSVSLGSVVMPGTTSIPGVDQAAMAVSMAPQSIAMSFNSSANTQPAETVAPVEPAAAEPAPVSAPEQAPVASDTPVPTASEPTVTLVITPDSAPQAASSTKPAPAAMPAASGTPAQHAAAPSAASSKKLAWGAVVSPSFVAKVNQICADLGCQSNDLMAAMAFESVQTFSPSVRNPMSGATGLIQFMDDTAQLLGTSTDELSAMTPEDQLTYVEKYFQPFRGHLTNLSDIYMAILWPRAVGQPEDYPLFPSGSVQYAQNASLDVDGDGVVTKQEAAGLVAAMQRKGERPEYVLIETPTVGGSPTRS